MTRPLADNPFDRFPRLYDWEHDLFQDDVQVYLAFARRFGSPVLELACGTGRILAALAAAGLPCTGVDSSPPMLGRARERLRRAGVSATLVLEQLQTTRLDGSFGTILFPLDSLGLLLSRTDQLAALGSARACVRHDGRLVLDVANGNLRGGPEPVEEVQRHLTASDPDTGRPITKWAVRRSDAAAQVDELTFLYDEETAAGCLRRTTVELRLRWFGRFELELLLERAGWEVAELYGSYELEPYGAASDRLLVVARPAAP